MNRKSEVDAVTELNDTLVVQTQDPAEQTIAEEIGQFVEEPDTHQKGIMVELARLHLSLRGPENLLDRGNYSRPIPPVQRTSTLRNSK
jgi:hypothetical protein